jgi:hypothetical protein
MDREWQRGETRMGNIGKNSIDIEVTQCISDGYSTPAKIAEQTGLPYVEVKKSVKRIANEAAKGRQYTIEALNAKKEKELMQLEGVCDNLLQQWHSSAKTPHAIKYIQTWLELKKRIDKLYGFEANSKNISNIQNNIQNNIILSENLRDKTTEELNRLWEATLED